MPAAPQDSDASRPAAEVAAETLDPQLDDLVAEVIVLRERGEVGALEQVCNANPPMATGLRERVAKLDRMRGAFVELQQASRLGETPRRFGHNLILRELGRGGMGVVYLARDERLGRDVALKAMTSPILAGERGRRRFEREVQAVAALEHPNIVQIYEAGEDHDAPYFTMQYVEGRTLAAVLDELRGLELKPTHLRGKHIRRATSGERSAQSAAVAPEGARDPHERSSGSRRSGSEPRSWSRGYIEHVARVVFDIAEALEHAHAHGVLHRDVKPSNVLVREDGRAMLFDFGLARIATEEAMTLTSNLVGTPYYVSPEQILGGRLEIDERTDVYSLGVTLYELLTLRVPFEGNTTQEILRKIVVKQPPPVRRLNPAVPRDLETLCHTAMAKDRDHRYRSAGELAADLRRFLQFRPVEARPVGAWTRGVRWTRRNPAPALAASLAVLLLVGGPLSFGVYSHAARERLQREQRATEVQRDLADQRAAEAERERNKVVNALAAAEEQRARADRNVARVLHTIDEMLTRVAEQDLVHVPRMDLLRREFLERALALHRELMLEEGDAPELVRDTAKAQRRLGSILHSLGRLEQAAQSARRAIEMQRPLAESPQATPQDLEELAAALTVAALVAEEAGETQSPESLLLEVVRLRERVAAELPNDDDARGRLADGYINLGNDHLHRGRQRDAEREFRRGLHHWTELVERAPEDPVRRLSRAEALIDLGAVLTDQGRSEEAEHVGRESLALWRSLLAENPEWYSARLGCLKASGNLADVLEDRGEFDEGLQLIEESIRLGSALLAERPDVPEFAEVLASAHGISVGLLTSAGRPEEAVEAGKRALEQLSELADRFPDIEGFRHRRASVYDKLALAYQWLSMSEEELAARIESVAARREIVESDPESLPQRSRLGGALNNLARAYSVAGDPLRAANLLDEAIVHQRLAFTAEPDRTQYRGFLRNHLWGLTESALAAGDPRRAAAAARRMPELDLAGGAEHRRAAGLLARCAAQADDEQLARMCATEALDLLHVALERNATSVEDLDGAPDLTSLRQLEDFQAWLAELREEGPR